MNEPNEQPEIQKSSAEANEAKIESESENFSETEKIHSIEVENEAQTAEMSPRNKFLIIGGIITAVLILIIGYLYFERNKNVDANATTDNAEAETVVSIKPTRRLKMTVGNK